MKMASERVTLALIGQKLDILSEDLRKHMNEDHKMFTDIRESLDGCDEYPGVRGRLDRLEQSKTSRDKHFWAIYGILISTLAALTIKWLSLQ